MENIDFNENTVIIKDGIKQQFFVMKFTVIIFLIQAVINAVLYYNNPDNFAYLLMAGGSGFVTILVGFGLYRESKKEIISFDEISRIKIKSILGRKYIRLELMDGKYRNLGRIRTISELDKIMNTFSEKGLQTSE